MCFALSNKQNISQPVSHLTLTTQVNALKALISLLSTDSSVHAKWMHMLKKNTEYWDDGNASVKIHMTQMNIFMELMFWQIELEKKPGF